jgi:hypothetical protein
MGGYDLYISNFANDKWTEPKSLGSPLNSKGHDVFFVLDA